MKQIDEGLKMMYETLFKLDVEKCIEVKGDLKNKEILVEDKLVTLEDFLKGHSKTVTIDQFSTKEMAKKAPENLKQKYMELFRIWNIIEYQEKTIGYMDRTLVYNGFPVIINTKEFIENPKDTFDQAITNLAKNPNDYKSIAELHAKPAEYAKTSLILLPKYYIKIADNDVGTNVNKILGETNG